MQMNVCIGLVEDFIGTRINNRVKMEGVKQRAGIANEC